MVLGTSCVSWSSVDVLGTRSLGLVMSVNLFCKDGSNISIQCEDKVVCSGQLGENEVVQSGKQLVEPLKEGESGL